MLTNLGYLTDIATLGAAAEIQRRPDHLTVRCRSMPTFYWGNFLLLPTAPPPAAIERWLAVFAETFADDPQVGHVAIGWQDHAGDAATVAGFAERGFETEDCVVMTLSAPPSARPLPPGLRIDRVAGDADWQATVELAVVSRDRRHTAEAYAAYVEGLVAERRREADAGRLHWYLARIDGRVVGDMGLYVVDEAPAGLPADGVDVTLPVARFQAVKTHPDFRGRGVCSALLSRVCRDGLGPLGLAQLVILVDEKGPAWRLYQRHGFRPAGRTRGVWRPPAGAWTAAAD